MSPKKIPGGVIVVEVILPPALLPALDEAAHVRVLVLRHRLEPRLVDDLRDQPLRLLAIPGKPDRVGARDGLRRGADLAEYVAVTGALDLAHLAGVALGQRRLPVTRLLVRHFLEAAVAFLAVRQAVVLEEHVEEVGSVSGVGGECGRVARARGRGVVRHEPDRGNVRHIGHGDPPELGRGGRRGGRPRGALGGRGAGLAAAAGERVGHHLPVIGAAVPRSPPPRRRRTSTPPRDAATP